ncbi:YgaP family membrane protein [Aliamphritea ceti]|uniref:YgaP family membrane protein n=1 Tax=Aliamphritea ceti TaxID=1524258 RepID=UPI0021C2E6C9|nr:DUF2892 domain-containing protein [Aliamphritea ceti]
MPKNLGNLDRSLRLIAGLILISLVFIGPQTAWGWVGIIGVLTAAIGYCPLYSLFGFKSCPLKHNS